MVAHELDRYLAGLLMILFDLFFFIAGERLAVWLFLPAVSHLKGRGRRAGKGARKGRLVERTVVYGEHHFASGALVHFLSQQLVAAAKKYPSMQRKAQIKTGKIEQAFDKPLKNTDRVDIIF